MTATTSVRPHKSTIVRFFPSGPAIHAAFPVLVLAAAFEVVECSRDDRLAQRHCRRAARDGHAPQDPIEPAAVKLPHAADSLSCATGCHRHQACENADQGPRPGPQA